MALHWQNGDVIDCYHIVSFMCEFRLFVLIILFIDIVTGLETYFMELKTYFLYLNNSKY